MPVWDLFVTILDYGLRTCGARGGIGGTSLATNGLVPRARDGEEVEIPWFCSL